MHAPLSGEAALHGTCMACALACPWHVHTLSGDAALLSNRSAARLQLGRAAAALEDARAAVAARPGWGKAELRAAAAHEVLGEAEAAVAGYEAAARCEPLGPQALASLARLRAAASGEGAGGGGGGGGAAAEGAQLAVGGVAAAREALRLGQVDDAVMLLDAAVRPPALSPPPYSHTHTPPSNTLRLMSSSCHPHVTLVSPSVSLSWSRVLWTVTPTAREQRLTPRCDSGPHHARTHTRRPTSQRRRRANRAASSHGASGKRTGRRQQHHPPPHPPPHTPPNSQPNSQPNPRP